MEADRGFPAGTAAKPPNALGMAVGVGDEGDVQNGSAVYQIRTPDPEHGAFRRLPDARSFTQDRAMGLGRKGGGWQGHPSGCCPQPGRADRRGPGIPDGPVKDQMSQMWEKSSKPRRASGF